MMTRRTAWLFLALSFLLYGGTNRELHAAPLQQIVPIKAPFLEGELPYQYNAHYYGLESTVRDGMVALTLNYEPQDNPNLKGFVNFFVLDEDGLRRFLAGEQPEPLAIAGGSPLQFDRVGNKMSAAFRVSGRGQYTVVVYNNSMLPITYTLVAEGGMLLDNANQSRATTTQTPEATATPVAAVTESAVSNPLGGAAGQQLTGELSNTIGRHYLEAVPTIRDGTILFNFHYDPLDQPALHGNVNFWVLDKDGLNAIVRGDKPANVNLATGFPAPFSPFPNDLQANFNASGKDPYTVVIYNQTEIPATYDMAIQGGTLYDRYGQTNEAKAAAAALITQTVSVLPTATAVATSVATPVAAVEEAEVVFVANPSTSQIAATATPVLPFGVAQLAGNFQGAYQHHYIALAPTLRDGTVTLSLAFDPRDSQALRENLNFLVLTEEGLQRVINGAPPSAYEIASGAYQDFGTYKGQLYASFNASGRGRYTVIVFNNSDTPARYQLTAEGGLIATENVDVALP